jgi:N-acetyltransferase
MSDAAEFIRPQVMSAQGVRLEPLSLSHLQGVIDAASDGALWQLRFTSVPEPSNAKDYIDNALAACANGERLHFAVIDALSNTVIGCTSYHDILPAVRRVEIGWTWYAKRVQRTHVNSSCKWLLLQHAFETLDCLMVGWRTDNVNFTSQRAIERLGAKKDGVIRGQGLRRDGSIRDTVLYSMSQQEWQTSTRAHLLWLLRDRAT